MFKIEDELTSIIFDPTAVLATNGAQLKLRLFRWRDLGLTCALTSSLRGQTYLIQPHVVGAGFLGAHRCPERDGKLTCSRSIELSAVP